MKNNPLLQLCRYYVSLQLVFLSVFTLNVFAQETNNTTQLVLSNATLIDGTGAPPQPNVTVIIKNGIIAEIVDGKVENLPPNIEVINLKDRFLLPGFIDSHVHIAHISNPEATLRKLFNAGITTVRDMGGDARTLSVLARDAKIGKIHSPDIYYSAIFFGPPFLQDPRSKRSALGTEPGTAAWSRIVTKESDLKQIVAEAKGTGATGLKLYSALEPQLVQKIVREAQQQGLKVWSHATIFPSKPSDAANAGVDVISHSGGLYAEARPDVPASYTEGIYHWMPKQNFASIDPSAPAYDNLFNILIRQGTLLEPTLAVFGGGSDSPKAQPKGRQSEAAQRIDIAALADWACAATEAAHEAGVTIVAGTDLTPRRYIPIFEEMEALHRCGLSPLEAIRAATLNGAQAIGLEATHGSAEVGKVADFVILNADPVENIRNVRNVMAVVKGGQMYKSEGSIE